ncbi:MAG TPA: hypothetical protein VGK40_02420 [Verrucomicrobiae bacterium]|jgi:hypothetical protein
MNEPEVQLNRLFAAARRAPPAEEAAAMPGPLKTRVLAHWRAAAAAEAGRSLALVFRTALVCAAIVMLVSVAWSFGELTHDPENEVAIANYELREDVMP